MDKEQTKKYIEVMQAFVDGKDIQYLDRNGEWLDLGKMATPAWNFSINEYRVKPEPKVRPYKDCDECWVDMQKHKPFGWVVDEDGDYISIHIVSNRTIDFDETFYYWKYIDGSPFGIVEE